MLPSKNLYHHDLAKAANELIGNIELLIWCGYFQDAFELSRLLLEPGPWKSRPGSEAIGVLSELLPWLAWLLGQTCPAVDGNPPRGQPALARFVQEREPYGFHVFHSGVQVRASKTPVTAELLASMPAPGTRGFAELHGVITSELSVRMGSQIGPAAGPKALWKPPAPDPHLAEFSNRQLFEAVARAVGSGKQHLPMITETLLKFCLLEIASGNSAGAADKLAPHLRLVLHDVLAMIAVPPFRELMRSGLLADRCGLHPEHIAAYRAQLQLRSPQTLVAPAKRWNWKAILKTWTREQAELGEIDFESMQAQAEYALPSCTELVALAKRKKLLAKPASEDELEALEQRIDLALPPSYRDFLLTSNGMLRPDGIHLLPCSAIDWMHAIDPETVDVWCRDTHEASDAEYAIYGDDQDCIHMRPRHLRRALMISQTEDGDSWLLIPDVRFGLEWEAWFLGAKNPGAFRYRSFGDLFAAQALAGDE